MKQLATVVVALALCLVGCGLLPHHGDPVQLLAGPPGYDYSASSCFAANVSGLLVVDPTYGTAIVANNHPSMLGLSDVPVTVAWRPGFTARRSGSEVEVLDPQGNVVATTGRSYQFWGGFVAAGGSSGIVWPELTKRVLWACSDPQPLP
jgi:hypothetical protein